MQTLDDNQIQNKKKMFWRNNSLAHGLRNGHLSYTSQLLTDKFIDSFISKLENAEITRNDLLIVGNIIQPHPP